MHIQYVWTPKNLFCVSAYLESVWEKQKKPHQELFHFAINI